MLTSGNGAVTDPPGWLSARDLPAEDEAKQHASRVGKELMSSLLPQELRPNNDSRGKELPSVAPKLSEVTPVPAGNKSMGHKKQDRKSGEACSERAQQECAEERNGREPTAKVAQMHYMRIPNRLQTTAVPGLSHTP